MIKDLQEFGKWLNENNQVDFGKNVKDDDFIFTILFENGKFLINSIVQKSECNLNYFEKSCFDDNLFHSTDQTIIIPSKRNLLGFSPFFIKLDHEFLKNGKLNEDLIKKFKDKIERSLNANRNNKEFVKIVNDYFNKSFLDKCPFNENQIRDMELVFIENDSKDVVDLILKYYTFLCNNYKTLVDDIINFKKSDNYTNKKGNFYLACIFSDSKDLLNDFFYNFSKFLKSRNNSYDDDVDGVCSICGNKTTTYPPLPYYSIRPTVSFNFLGNVKNSKLKLCKNCSSFIRYADDKLNNIIKMDSILIIPKVRNTYNFTEFLKIANQEMGSFEKLNKFLKDCPEFNFDLLIVSNDKKNNTRIIKKYIENYKAFLVQFEKLHLYHNNSAHYLFNEEVIKDKKNYLNNTFAFENIFKEFFYEIDGKKGWKFPNLYNFYEIYTKDLTGSGGIFNNFSSQTVAIFSQYAESIFEFIYNVNLDSLNKDMINEIVLNSLIKIQNNSFNEKNFKFDILKRLNYYFMLKKEFLGDNMLENGNVIQLKRIFGRKNDDENSIVLSNEDEFNIEKLINKDIALKYYLLGQFIAYIDIMKKQNGKNNNVFSNFIDNVTRNNIKKIFVTEILQKNNFYINKFGKKGKFVFKILEMNTNNLFDESNDFDYEDYILLLFTGYYTQNILINNYEFKEELI